MKYPLSFSGACRRQLRPILVALALPLLVTFDARCQTHISLQPFAQQVRQAETSLAYLGQPLSQQDQDAINQAIGKSEETAAILQLENILDKYTLAVVEINPESRVKVQQG